MNNFKFKASDKDFYSLSSDGNNIIYNNLIPEIKYGIFYLFRNESENKLQIVVHGGGISSIIFNNDKELIRFLEQIENLVSLFKDDSLNKENNNYGQPEIFKSKDFKNKFLEENPNIKIKSRCDMSQSINIDGIRDLNFDILWVKSLIECLKDNEVYQKYEIEKNLNFDNYLENLFNEKEINF